MQPVILRTALAVEDLMDHQVAHGPLPFAPVNIAAAEQAGLLVDLDDGRVYPDPDRLPPAVDLHAWLADLEQAGPLIVTFDGVPEGCEPDIVALIAAAHARRASNQEANNAR